MDIFKLLNSKTREKILRFFFSNMEKRYYLRELERILSLSVGNIRRELKSLEKIHLFKREKIGNQVYYSLDKSSPFFKGVETILSTTTRAGSKETRTKLRKKTTERRLTVDKNFTVIRKDDLDLLVSKINDLENILEDISKNVPSPASNSLRTEKSSKLRMGEIPLIAD